MALRINLMSPLTYVKIFKIFILIESNIDYFEERLTDNPLIASLILKPRNYND